MSVSRQGKGALALLTALALVGLATPSFAARSPELVPQTGKSAAVRADGRVVYAYDRTTYASRPAGKTSGGPDMTWHGGKVLTTTFTHPIFWGAGWSGYTGDKVSGIDKWYSGFSNSDYAKTTTEYTGLNGTVGATTSAATHLTDTSAASGGSDASVILNEVAAALKANNETPPTDGSGYYPVYTDQPRGSAGYCAWHSSGTIDNTPVQFAFFWNLDGDSGCDPQSTVPNRTEGLAALANVSGHELAEAMTDPASPNAWYDSSGYENGDKCAWTFGAPYVTFTDGTEWRIQGEWSNHAYDTRTGYLNSKHQPGCLSGV